MIEFLQGKVCRSGAGLILKTSSGVGYGVEVPLITLAKLKSDDEVELWIHTVVREDAIRLFGFESGVEQQVFKILIATNGVGPKMALAILSSLTLDELYKAVTHDDLRLLVGVPGIGKRTAERIVVELRPKLEKMLPLLSEKLSHGPLFAGGEAALKDAGQHALQEEIHSALSNLGFKDKDISGALQKLDLQASGDFGEHVRAALVYLRGGGRSGRAVDNKLDSKLESVF